MRTRRLFISSVILCSLLSGAAFAQSKTGKVTVKLTVAQGFQENGTPAPAKDAACKTKYAAYIGAPVTDTYDINPTTGIMSASANFQNVDTKLFPMGLSGSYSFMSDGVPPELQKIGVMRIIFQISKTFTNPSNSIMFPLETGYNCVLSSSALKAANGKALLTGKPKH